MSFTLGIMPTHAQVFAPTAAIRKKAGGGKGIKKGAFPITSVKSARSAINMRGLNKGGGGKKAVLDKVAKSPYAKDPVVKKKLAAARMVDGRRKRK